MDPSPSPVVIDTIVDSVGDVVTSAMGWAGDVVTFIVGHPLILVFAISGLVGLGIGLVKRLINV